MGSKIFNHHLDLREIGHNGTHLITGPCQYLFFHGLGRVKYGYINFFKCMGFGRLKSRLQIIITQYICI